MDQNNKNLTQITNQAQIGVMIRARREELGLKQGDLAGYAGVDQGNLSKIERGESRATIETYLRLLSALGIEIFSGNKP